MAREAYLILDCSLYTDSIAEIIRAFQQIGWDFADGQTEYLPLHDDDMFDWQAAPLSDAELFALIAEKQACGELCGVILYHQESDRGFSLFAKNTAEVMLNLTVNRKTVCGDFTDASWYIEHTAAALECIGCTVQAMNYNEIIG